MSKLYLERLSRYKAKTKPTMFLKNGWVNQKVMGTIRTAFQSSFFSAKVILPSLFSFDLGAIM